MSKTFSLKKSSHTNTAKYILQATATFITGYHRISQEGLY